MESTDKPCNSILGSNHFGRIRNSNLLRWNRVNRKADLCVQTIILHDCQGRIVQPVIMAEGGN